MKALGSVEFSIEELPDELNIRYVRHAGWIERILAPAAVPVFAVVGWFWQRPVMIIGAGGVAVFLIARWAWGHESVLRVLPDRLVASVYLWSSRETALSEIQAMQWQPGDAWWTECGKPAGLYISRGGRWECVFPLASREQASDVLDAITRRFPRFRVTSTPWSI
jgi:hypothetical protein